MSLTPSVQEVIWRADPLDHHDWCHLWARGEPREQPGQGILGTVEVLWLPSRPSFLCSSSFMEIIIKINVVSSWGAEGLCACQPRGMLLGGSLPTSTSPKGCAHGGCSVRATLETLPIGTVCLPQHTTSFCNRSDPCVSCHCSNPGKQPDRKGQR